MKKFISFLLVATIVSMVMSVFSVCAITEELLINPGFETGDETGFKRYGASSNIEIDKDYARTGEYGMLLSNRANGYATWAQDISNILILNGPGEYTASVWIKLAKGQEPCTVHLTMIVQSNDAHLPCYYTSDRKTLTTEWQQFIFQGNIDFDPVKGFKTALLYQQSEGGQGAPDIMLDDFSLKKNSEVNGILPIRYGDLNDDGIINKKDELALRKYLAIIDVEINLKSADVYFDNAINKKDLLLLKQYLAGWEVELGK